jgi:chromosome segregation protein
MREFSRYRCSWRATCWEPATARRRNLPRPRPLQTHCAACAADQKEPSIYLKSIDIFGFKTFADRTRLVFEPGISAIVGPNGSGKSNFVDAVRWVLGEQSAKQLRGARMDEVIFAGNSHRRPLGMAEVTLTFDNADGALATPFAEVAVTRRAYRSGEGEYFLNKTQVRLRDIMDLLLGTGLGPDASAIISQGQIDAILSAKPESRREIFEEAAGTSKPTPTRCASTT